MIKEKPPQQQWGGSLQEEFLTNSFQSLFEIRNNVFRSFRPYGKPNKVRPYTRLHKLFIRQLAVRMAGGMENAGTGVRYMGHDGGQLQTVHELDGTLTASLDAEGYYTAGLATAELLLRQFIILIGRKTRIVDPGNIFLPLQCRGTRRWRVSSPRLSKKAFCGD